MRTKKESEEWLRVARNSLEVNIHAIEKACTRLDGNLTKAVEILLEHHGKVIVSGVGKSGHIGQKIAATLCSTGSPAVFLHAAEAVHGDLGIYTPGDPTILISKSGSTGELVRLIPILRQFNSPLIAIVGNLNSTIATQSDVVLDARVVEEADPLGIVPSASAMVALALGDALAIALMAARRFSEQDYFRYHPGGQLGRNLWLHVSDVMRREKDVAWATPETSLKDLVILMTERPLGAACITDEGFRLLGLVTDGDIRRALQTHEDIRPLRAKDIMTVSPITISPNALLKEAACLMEDRPSQISVLPVLDVGNDRCLGLIRIHDIYQPNLT
jgi:arabinose-5-phosphate isomerase